LIEGQGFGEEIVHIVPLGFEVDRAVKPFEKYKANKAYLLCIVESPKYSRSMLQRQKHYLDIVTRRLNSLGIEVQFSNTDTFDLLEVVGTIAKIIREEKSRKNRVFVNMSAAGRLTSFGAALAAMHQGARVYYVVADDYSKTEEELLDHGISICRKLRMQFIENLRLSLPDERAQMVLAKLCREERGMKTDKIIGFLREEGVEGFDKEYERLERPQKINYLMKLNKGILEKLAAEGYITRERVGKYNTIKITESGKYVAHISGLV